MSTPEGETTQEVVAETASTPEATASPDTPVNPYDGLPEDFKWMVKELETTRREAAAARVSARETAEKFKDAKTPEEVEALRNEMAAQVAAIERKATLVEAVHKHNVPENLVEFITGNTPEEIEAQAVKLASVAASAVTPTVITKLPPAGGTTPAGDQAELDGRALYKKHKARK